MSVKHPNIIYWGASQTFTVSLFANSWPPTV